MTGTDLGNSYGRQKTIEPIKQVQLEIEPVGERAMQSAAGDGPSRLFRDKKRERAGSRLVQSEVNAFSF